MDRGNVNPTQHFPWWLRETTKITPIRLVITGIWTMNSPNTNTVWRISIGVMLCAFKSFITDRISQSAGAGIGASISNRSNDATVRTRKVPQVHAPWCHYSITYTQSLHAINGLLAMGRGRNILCRQPSYYTLLRSGQPFWKTVETWYISHLESICLLRGERSVWLSEKSTITMGGSPGELSEELVT